MCGVVSSAISFNLPAQVQLQMQMQSQAFKLTQVQVQMKLASYLLSPLSAGPTAAFKLTQAQVKLALYLTSPLGLTTLCRQVFVFFSSVSH